MKLSKPFIFFLVLTMGISLPAKEKIRRDTKKSQHSKVVLAPDVEMATKRFSAGQTVSPGDLEREVKHQLKPSIFTVITKEDQEPFVQIASLLNKPFTPQTITIVDLSNENITSIEQVYKRIQTEQDKLQLQIDDLDKQIAKINFNIALAQDYDNTEAQEAFEDDKKQLQTERAALEEQLNLMQNENIDVINLARNGIRNVPQGAFDRYPNIKALDLSANGIRTVHQEAFSNLRQLSVLNLASNKKMYELPVNAVNVNLSILNISDTGIIRSLGLRTTPHTRQAMYNMNQLKTDLPNTYIITNVLSRSVVIDIAKAVTVIVLIYLLCTQAPAIAKFFLGYFQFKAAIFVSGVLVTALGTLIYKALRNEDMVTA